MFRQLLSPPCTSGGAIPKNEQEQQQRCHRMLLLHNTDVTPLCTSRRVTVIPGGDSSAQLELPGRMPGTFLQHSLTFLTFGKRSRGRRWHICNTVNDSSDSSAHSVPNSPVFHQLYAGISLLIREYFCYSCSTLGKTPLFHVKPHKVAESDDSCFSSRNYTFLTVLHSSPQPSLKQACSAPFFQDLTGFNVGLRSKRWYSAQNGDETNDIQACFTPFC